MSTPSLSVSTDSTGESETPKPPLLKRGSTGSMSGRRLHLDLGKMPLSPRRQTMLDAIGRSSVSINPSTPRTSSGVISDGSEKHPLYRRTVSSGMIARPATPTAAVYTSPALAAVHSARLLQNGTTPRFGDSEIDALEPVNRPGWDKALFEIVKQRMIKEREAQFGDKEIDQAASAFWRDFLEQTFLGVDLTEIRARDFRAQDEYFTRQVLSELRNSDILIKQFYPELERLTTLLKDKMKELGQRSRWSIQLLSALQELKNPEITLGDESIKGLAAFMHIVDQKVSKDHQAAELTDLIFASKGKHSASIKAALRKWAGFDHGRYLYSAVREMKDFYLDVQLIPSYGWEWVEAMFPDSPPLDKVSCGSILDALYPRDGVPCVSIQCNRKMIPLPEPKNGKENYLKELLPPLLSHIYESGYDKGRMTLNQAEQVDLIFCLAKRRLKGRGKRENENLTWEEFQKQFKLPPSLIQRVRQSFNTCPSMQLHALVDLLIPCAPLLRLISTDASQIAVELAQRHFPALFQKPFELEEMRVVPSGTIAIELDDPEAYQVSVERKFSLFAHQSEKRFLGFITLLWTLKPQTVLGEKTWHGFLQIPQIYFESGKSTYAQRKNVYEAIINFTPARISD